MKRLITSLVLTSALLCGSLGSIGCGANDLSKLHDILNKAAKAENAAAKTNHSLYESGTYGAVGSEGAIHLRQKAATVIHGSNEKLILALTLAQGLTPATFEAGKLAVLQSLSQAAAGLSTGNQTIDLVLQSITLLINQAVAIVQLFRAQDLHFALPEIRAWRIAEVAV